MEWNLDSCCQGAFEQGTIPPAAPVEALPALQDFHCKNQNTEKSHINYMLHWLCFISTWNR